MDFHAHPTEWIWSIAALAAVGGTLKAWLLAYEDRTLARYSQTMRDLNADLRFQMAQHQLTGEFMRLTISTVVAIMAVVSLFSYPEASAEFNVYPQTMVNIICGTVIAFVIIIWAWFDIFIVRKIVEKRTTNA